MPPSAHPPLPSGLFLAGTDTSVGKTTVAEALLRLARRRRLPLLPFKPAETGPSNSDAATDSARLRAAARLPALPLTDLCPFQFGIPLAPGAAAAAAGASITLADIQAAARHLQRDGAPLLIEAAGGLLSPYSDELTSADLAAAFGYPLILIARNALGTINHTALSVAEIRRRRLFLLGIILVDTTPIPDPSRQTNPHYIEKLTGIVPLGVLPFVPLPQPDALADAFSSNLDAERILQAITPAVPGPAP